MRSSDWSSDVCSSDLKRWVVYAKPPFAGPEAVLAYLSRYTHRVAISNSRLLRFDDAGVTFRYKDYRKAGAGRQQVMTLAADEFIRRFLLHALPRGFHRIRHYGLLASARRKDHLERARSEEHTSELQSLMRISYAVFCLKKKKHNRNAHTRS